MYVKRKSSKDNCYSCVFILITKCTDSLSGQGHQRKSQSVWNKLEDGQEGVQKGEEGVGSKRGEGSEIWVEAAAAATAWIVHTFIWYT